MDNVFDKKIFAARLKSLMEESNDTTYSLGDKLHLSNATISRYCTGDIAPKLTTVNVIADLYGVNPVWLMGNTSADKYTDAYGKPKVKTIPVVGRVAAGTPILAEENIEDYIVVDDRDSVDFALKVRGDSMINARIYDGDFIFVRKQPVVENGEIAIVLVEDEATCKRLYQYGKTIVLRPENGNYKEMVYNKSDNVRIEVIGKVIFLKSYLK